MVPGKKMDFEIFKSDSNLSNYYLKGIWQITTCLVLFSLVKWTQLTSKIHRGGPKLTALTMCILSPPKSVRSPQPKSGVPLSIFCDLRHGTQNCPGVTHQKGSKGENTVVPPSCGTPVSEVGEGQLATLGHTASEWQGC